MILVYGFVITVPVVTFAKVSATHEDAISPVDKAVYEEDGVDSAGAHHADNPDMGRILKTRHPCCISRRVAAPVAQEAQDSWFKFVTCHLSLAISLFLPMELIYAFKRGDNSSSNSCNFLVSPSFNSFLL